MWRRKAVASRGAHDAAQGRVVDAGGLLRVEAEGDDVGVAVVARHRTVGLEEAAAVLERGEVAGVAAGVDRARPGQVGHEVAEVGAARLEVAVRAERRDDARGEAGVVAQGAVVVEVVHRVVRRREDLDAEAVHERARPEVRGGDGLGDAVVDRVGALGRESLGDAEDVGEHAVHPEAAGRPAEGRPVLGEQAPGASRLVGGERPATDAEVVERARPARGAGGRRSGRGRRAGSSGPRRARRRPATWGARDRGARRSAAARRLRRAGGRSRGCEAPPAGAGRGRGRGAGWRRESSCVPSSTSGARRAHELPPVARAPCRRPWPGERVGP